MGMNIIDVIKAHVETLKQQIREAEEFLQKTDRSRAAAAQELATLKQHMSDAVSALHQLEGGPR